jgi:hypothetical protein
MRSHGDKTAACAHRVRRADESDEILPRLKSEVKTKVADPRCDDDRSVTGSCHLHERMRRSALTGPKLSAAGLQKDARDSGVERAGRSAFDHDGRCEKND